jgi:hypothetical protein
VPTWDDVVEIGTGFPGVETARPDVFFTTPHYDGHPYVLVRLDVVDRQQLAELLEDAWRIRAPKRVVAEYDGRQPN